MLTQKPICERLLFNVGFIHNCRNLEHKCPFAGERVNKQYYVNAMDYLLSNTKEQTTSAHNVKGDSQMHYAN